MQEFILGRTELLFKVPKHNREKVIRRVVAVLMDSLGGGLMDSLDGGADTEFGWWPTSCACQG